MTAAPTSSNPATPAVTLALVRSLLAEVMPVLARARAAQLALAFCWHPSSDDVLHGVGSHSLDQLRLDDA
ncbi:MAG: hypothetical protein H7287_14100 [Thermoleophilia bacterium]|nr:hypothetical protein [Thermoleophilia bacterium]